MIDVCAFSLASGRLARATLDGLPPELLRPALDVDERAALPSLLREHAPWAPGDDTGLAGGRGALFLTFAPRRGGLEAPRSSQMTPDARTGRRFGSWGQESLDRHRLRDLRFAANMANTTGRTLGELLREARTAADLSLRDLAKKLSISPSYISDIENDRRVPSEEVLRDLANTFGLNFDDLMAMAGRVGDQTERYLRHHPTAGILFRRISDKHLPEKDLQQLVNAVEQMGKKKNPS